MKKLIGRFIMGGIICVCISGGCRQEEGQSQNTQSSDNGALLGSEVIPGGTNVGGMWLKENITANSSAAYENGASDRIASVSGTGDAGNTSSAEGQILDQTFDVTLDGWGDVTFACFEPAYFMEMDQNGNQRFGDVRIMLMQNNQAVYTFPGVNEENAWFGQQFGQVTSVAFRDYNEDGRMDILMLLEYAGVQGPNIDVPFSMARLYTQKKDDKEFLVDEYLTAYVNEGGQMVHMKEVYRRLEEYAYSYKAGTSKSAWEVERFAEKVKELVLNGDFQGLAKEIAYPIGINGVIYQNEDEFLKADFVGNLSPEILTELEAESCKGMFANWQGVMLGNGCVWIGDWGSELKVIALNRFLSAGD